MDKNALKFTFDVTYETLFNSIQTQYLMWIQ